MRGAGKTAFVLVPSICSDRAFDWRAETPCLACGRTFTLRRRDAAAVLKAGNEVIGAVCRACLTPDCLQRLADLAQRRPVRDDEGEAVAP